MENLSVTLKQQAISLGLCRQWQKSWGDCTRQQLIDKFKKGIDFCIEHNYPSNDFIRTNFDAKLLRDNQIYVDEHLSLTDAPNGVYVLNGECSGTIRFGSWAAATVYVRHTSTVSIIAEDFAKVYVRVYDEAEVNVVDVGDASVKVYERR